MDFLILKKQYPLFAQTAGFFVLSIYDHGYIKADQRWNFNSVCSPFNRLYLICAGQARVRNKNQDILLKKNTAFLIPAGSENSYSCDSFLEKFYLHFRMELIPGR
ncbi:MAG TPA: hypothetical protein DC049_07775, partial [Spirochaetia bacterium]|nr:hypothetical protein [Spirochaetia bacterium]